MGIHVHICVLAALFAAGSAIISQPLSCSHPDICAPRVITNCPRKDAIAECPTCCCETTPNVEFYNPDRPEPRCTAPPAVYSVKFVGTWTGACNPDYYVPTAHWSPPTGASHNTEYRMWDACMDNVSPGVAQVSQTGATRLIEQEYAAAGSNILDSFKSQRINGSGETTGELDVDKNHQWVSTVTMLAPSLDRMVGVAGLQLCYGHDWKRSVTVCSELFSTATRSERFHPSMQRNSIQWNNCSFGYFEFTFKEYKNSSQEMPKKTDLDRRICPKNDKFQDKCGRCCCQSSDNVDYYHHGKVDTPCGATDDAVYKFLFTYNVNPVCHPEFPINPVAFTEPLVTSHTPAIAYDKNGFYEEGFPAYIYYMNADLEFSTLSSLFEYREKGYYHDFYSKGRLDYRFSGHIEVSPTHSHIAFASKLVPSETLFVGFDGLNVCGERGWKDRVEVCLELMTLVNKTENPDAEVSLQKDQCSFGSVVFDLVYRPRKTPKPPPTCVPHDESIFEVLTGPNEACCFCEFIIEGRVIRTYERQYDPEYSHTLLVKVTAVFYDEIDEIKVGDVVEIKICSLPRRVKRNTIYRLTGSRECGSNELEISSNGIFADIQLGVGPCVPYIKAGNCDDPR